MTDKVYHAVWPCDTRCFVVEIEEMMRAGFSDDFVIYEADPDVHISYDEVMKVKSGQKETDEP